MKINKILVYSFLCSVGTVLYTSAVAYILINLQNFLGRSPNIGGMAALLILYIISALVTGGLVLGGPAHLYFEKKRKEALQFLGLNLSWLILICLIIVLI